MGDICTASGDVCFPSGVSLGQFCKAEMILLVLQLRPQNQCLNCVSQSRRCGSVQSTGMCEVRGQSPLLYTRSTHQVVSQMVAGFKAGHLI